MYDNTTVLGGAVKVVTDAEGNMLGLTSSIVYDLPEAVTEGITAAEAEQIVLEHAPWTRQQELTLVNGLTARMILPIALRMDIEDEDAEGSRYVWVVYTTNPDSSVKPLLRPALPGPLRDPFRRIPVQPAHHHARRRGGRQRL